MPDHLGSLAVFAGICLATASSGAVFKPGPWYETLRKPGWTPPNWVFPVVWTVLFVMMAVAGWLAWRAAGWDASTALTIYGIQLMLNALWSALFFGLRRPDLALAEVTLLWLSIAATIIAFMPIDPWAAWLMAPYLLWVSIAAALNFSIWRLNRGGLAAPA